MTPWMIWIAIGVVCMIIEIFTPGFLFMSFGIGAILTGLISLLPFITMPFQILIFAVFTFLVFLNLRKFSKKLIPETSEETNIYALKGKFGIITKEILPDSRGYVKIEGEEWSAISSDNKKIEKDEKVVIDTIEGNKAIVSPANIKEV
ncbi:MAG: NfeD family protein [Candidatus Cloacimonetes bacterium]|nr:NfeD family protein [Candidatus Cloacimonadota bacterium]